MPNNYRIKKIMYEDARGIISPLVFFLSLLSIVYGGIVRLRYALYSWGILKTRRLPCTVISIGNITVGGTGKTPMTIYVAQLLEHLGYNIAIISRGYKGNAESIGGVLSDGNTLLMDANDAGDEPIMMAVHLRNIPVLVGKHRFDMGMIAKSEFNSDIIILDDGFQHLKLKRDIDLVLLDSEHPLGNSYILPRGTLREPVKGLKRGDAFIMTRSDQADNLSGLNIIERFQDKPVFKTWHTPYYFKVDKGSVLSLKKIKQSNLSDDFAFLKGQKVLAFSGIAGNHHFKRTVKSTECFISDFIDFPDHYQYSNVDFDHIVSKAKQLNVEYVITTEKDYMRMYKNLSWPMDLVVVGVKISFEDDKTFHTFIKDKLGTIEN